MRSIYLGLLATCVASITPVSAVAADSEIRVSDAITAAVAAPTRTPTNLARDAFRHPAETLAFFGVDPDETLLELYPGGGWYSEILGPLLRVSGTYYAAPPPGKGQDAFSAKVAADPARYGKVKIVSWPPAADAIATGSLDTILTFRNVHNLVMNGTAERDFATFFALLKPGGTLGVVDHRLPEDRTAEAEKTSGYVKLSSVLKLAEAAGFVLEAQSEINANPKDKADHPKGVWTLPPILALGAQDREAYLAIGESDRMTLRFRKPR